MKGGKGRTHEIEKEIRKDREVEKEIKRVIKIQNREKES